MANKTRINRCAAIAFCLLALYAGELKADGGISNKDTLVRFIDGLTNETLTPQMVLDAMNLKQLSTEDALRFLPELTHYRDALVLVRERDVFRCVRAVNSSVGYDAALRKWIAETASIKTDENLNDAQFRDSINKLCDSLIKQYGKPVHAATEPAD